MSTTRTRTNGTATSTTASRILDIAERLFAERGYAAVSVREIAGSVGVNQASLYNHFPSKQALYEAVLERGLRPIGERLAEGATRLLTPELGDRLIEELVDQLWRTPNLPKLIEREMLDDGEVFERLSERWLRPILDEAHRAMAAASAQTSWPADQLPLVLVGMYHLLFGFFTAGGLLHRVIGVDPQAPGMRAVQIEFLKEASRRLMRPSGLRD